MNLLSILLNAEKMWATIPDGEKASIIEALERMAQKVTDHKDKMADK